MQKVSERLARKLVRPAHAHAIPYRPDIDGLRAVAVWLVVFYHFGVPFLGGGYTGVDVFFVISGYLITTIILTQVQSGRFSLLQFYERRARRILPALFVVMAASTVAALALFIPADLVAFAESAAATTVFASNFYFNERSGYFSPAAELQPLLHTWSLAIEEQFYLIHPLALIVLARWRALPSGIVVALGVSFLVSVYSVTHHPTPAFYLLPARAWELSVGALLAIGVIAPPRAFLAASVAGLAGLALILGSATVYAPTTPFPGAAALAPVVGTALVIWSGLFPNAVAARVLALRPLVGLGLISYSLYLWHWPVLTFAQYWLGRTLRFQEAVVALLGIVGASILTYLLVERPFRNRRAISRRWVVRSAVAASGIGLFAAAVIVGTGGLPNRMAEETQALLAFKPERIAAPCLSSLQVDKDKTVCVRGKPGTKPSFVLAGDSHAGAVAPAFFRSAESLGLSGYQLTEAGFIPLPGVFAPKQPSWSAQTPAFLDLLRANPSLRLVVLIGHWEMRANGSTVRYKRIEFRDADYDGSGTAYNKVSLHRGLTRLVEMFPDRRFVLIEAVPTSHRFDPSAAARLIHLNGSNRVSGSYGIDRAEYEQQRDSYRAIFSELARRPNVSVLPVAEELCGPRFCSGWRDGVPIFLDSNHLTHTGALLLEGVFRISLQQALGR